MRFYLLHGHALAGLGHQHSRHHVQAVPANLHILLRSVMVLTQVQSLCGQEIEEQEGTLLFVDRHLLILANSTLVIGSRQSPLNSKSCTYH